MAARFADEVLGCGIAAYAGDVARDVVDHGQGPRAPRMRLGSRLRRLREAAGVSREDAGSRIRCSESKISRMELGQVGFKERDVADLLTMYGVKHVDTRDELMNLVRLANAPAWWQTYGDIVPGWFADYVGLESNASLIRTYEVQFVPGLLQTEAYARAVTLLGHRGAYADEINQRVRFRMRRKAQLDRPEAPKLWTVLDEAALRRPIGGVDVLREQLIALRAAARLPHITIQVMPFGAGGHSAAGGAFSILRFPERDLDDIVYIEQMIGATYLHKQDEIEFYTIAMDHLCAESPPPDHTDGIIAKIITELD